jgi:hypothetical protein
MRPWTCTGYYADILLRVLRTITKISARMIGLLSQISSGYLTITKPARWFGCSESRLLLGRNCFSNENSDYVQIFQMRFHVCASSSRFLLLSTYEHLSIILIRPISYGHIHRLSYLPPFDSIMLALCLSMNA